MFRFECLDSFVATVSATTHIKHIVIFHTQNGRGREREGEGKMKIDGAQCLYSEYTITKNYHNRNECTVLCALLKMNFSLLIKLAFPVLFN